VPQFGVDASGYGSNRAPEMFADMEPQQLRAEQSTNRDAARKYRAA
jgi:hypothetical protein